MKFSSTGSEHPDLQSGGSAVSRSAGSTPTSKGSQLCEPFFIVFSSVGSDHPDLQSGGSAVSRSAGSTPTGKGSLISGPFFMPFYVYILHSFSLDRYYISHTGDDLGSG
jgi:hypothetical protein